MRIASIMSREVDWVTPAVTVAEAARRMLERDVGFLPIARNDRLIGMLTDRDIVLRAIAERRDIGRATVCEAMSHDVLYAFADESLEAAARRMAENGVRRLPVLNREKRLVGVVSLGDIAARGSRRLAAEALLAIAGAGHDRSRNPAAGGTFSD